MTAHKKPQESDLGMNNQVSTETKKNISKDLIKVLEECKNFDIKKLSEIEVEIVFSWPSILSSFVEFYALFYEGLCFRDFIIKGVLKYLESCVDLHLKDTHYGDTLSKLIQQTLNEQIESYFDED
ncbi:MAG: hypothetical protein KAU62_16485, partial [Candidatus Heimdallarchaeota archaeon]|nr:hypothetical protein [Candidatus Heimdallarchaeota archaeon]MCK4612754.1 hypothetical protein [Candidatus Heimdallarchaeota archaeon]